MSMLHSSLFLVCLLLVEIHGDFTCNPILDCLNFEEGGLVPDPNDCEAYYTCELSGENLVPSSSSTKCPVGYYFSGFTGICETEYSIGVCDEDYCNGPHSGICKSTCTNTNEKIGNPDDCTAYYQCTIDGVENGTCVAPTPYFNGNTCVSLLSECCDFCKPYCFAIGVQVADPYDCTKFYICTAIGSVQETYHLSCSDGEYFDAPNGICVPGDSCTEMC